MAGGRGAASSRGRGGGKFKKFTRGGGHHFSRDLKPLDAEGNEVSMWSENHQNPDEKDSDDSEEESSEEESEEESEDEVATKKAEMTREERRQAKKAQKAAAAKKKKGAVQVGDMPTDSEEESDEDVDLGPANPNHSKAARKQTLAPVTRDDDDDDEVGQAAAGVKKMAVSGKAGASAAKGNMSRREREALEAAQAKENYRRMHEAGKTDEAKADMARLAAIREKRAADAARRQAEKEEAEQLAAAKKAEIETREAKKREAALGKPAAKGKKASKK